MFTKNTPPPLDYRFNEHDRKAASARFWHCPLRLVEDGTWARLWRSPGRLRGGGAAGSLLPVLALHVWPGQQGAEPGWTGWVRLSWRHLARLAGLDKDTVGSALAELAAAGLVESRADPLPEDVRALAWHRVSARAFAGRGEPYVALPGMFMYGGGWGLLPGAAARHLLIAWAAHTGALRRSPDAGPLPRTLGALLPGLAMASGLRRTSLRRAASDLAAWETPAGDRLIRDVSGFLRPDFSGAAARCRWDLALLEDRAETAAVRRMGRPRKTASGGGGHPASGGSMAGAAGDTPVPGPAPREGPPEPSLEPGSPENPPGDTPESAPGRRRTRPRKLRTPARPSLPLPPGASLPPLEGPGAFELRKQWWLERYLEGWANRCLRRRKEPVEQAVFIDLAPGRCDGALSPGLLTACEIAWKMRMRNRPRTTPLRIVAVVQGTGAAQQLRAGRAGYAPAVQVAEADPAEYLQNHEQELEGKAVLVFLGEVESGLVSWPMLRVALRRRDGVVVALSRAGIPEPGVGRRWVRGGLPNEKPERRTVEWLARTAVTAGAASVLSTVLRARSGAMAGVVVHAGGNAATLAWKAAIGTARRRAGEIEAAPWWNPWMAADAAQEAFAGESVPWASPPGGGPCLRDFYLRETPLLPRDLMDVRQELVWRGLRRSHRPLVFDFPAAVTAGDASSPH